MNLTRGHFSGRNYFTLLINGAMSLILKRELYLAAASHRSIRIGGGYILLIGRTRFCLLIAAGALLFLL